METSKLVNIAKREPEEKLTLTVRDEKILRDIYRFRTMTVRQIKEVHFKTAKWSAYKRMKQLERFGYVMSKPLVVDGRKVSTCYYVTDMALRELGLSVTVPMRKILEPRKQSYRVAVSQIYVALHGFYQFIDSRQTKYVYHLPKNAQVNGILKIGGVDWAVYLFKLDPEPLTVSMIFRELEVIQHAGLDHAVIFYQSPGTREAVGMDHRGMSGLRVMPYPLGLEVLKKLSSPRALLATPNLDLSGCRVEEAHEPFADLLVHQGKRIHYVTELLTGDLSKVYHLRNYTRDQAEARRRGVQVLVPEDDIFHYRAIFSPGYGHVKLVPVPRSWSET